MSIERKSEINTTVALLTAIAAIATSIMLATDAYAATVPQKKSTVTVVRAKKTKPIYVHITGDRRAAEIRARQAYATLLAQEQAARDAQVAQVEDYGTAYAETWNSIPANVASNVNSYPVQSAGYQQVFPGLFLPNNTGFRGGYGNGSPLIIGTYPSYGGSFNGYGYMGTTGTGFTTYGNNTGYSGTGTSYNGLVLPPGVYIPGIK